MGNETTSENCIEDGQTVICKHPRNRETYCTKVKRLNRPANGKSYKNRRMNFKFMILKKTDRQTDKGMVKQILSNG